MSKVYSSISHLDHDSLNKKIILILFHSFIYCSLFYIEKSLQMNVEFIKAKSYVVRYRIVQR